MKHTLLLFLCAFSVVSAQVRQVVSAEPVSGNLPMQTIENNDLIAISVYDSPELTRGQGVGGRIHPASHAGREDQGRRADAERYGSGDCERFEGRRNLVEPVVTVTIAEYHSRSISVMGSVRRPTVFQATAPVTLLDALARVETAEAGPVILLTRSQSKGVQRIGSS